MDWPTTLDKAAAAAMYDNAYQRLQKQPMVLVWQSQQEPIYYNAATVGDFEESCLVCLNDQLKAGMFTGKEKLMAEMAVSLQDYECCWAILALSADRAHQGVSLEHLRGGSKY